MVPKVITWIIIMGPYPSQTQALVPIPALNEEMMWVHPNLVEGQWATIVSKKKIRMEKNLDCYVIFLALEDTTSQLVCSLTLKKSRLSC